MLPSLKITGTAIAASVLLAISAANAGTVADFKATLSTTPVSATVNGAIVTQVIPFASGATSKSFLIQDVTGAMEVFSMPTATYDPQVGDSIDVTGLSEAFHGLYESHSPYTITVNSSGNPTTPTAFTVAQFQSSFDSSLQSFVGTLSNVTFTSSGTFALNTNYTVTDGTLTADIFIPANVALIGQTIPSGPVNISGYYGEFDGVGSNLPPDNSLHELDAVTITAAPEPASLALLAVGAVAMISRRRRA